LGVFAPQLVANQKIKNSFCIKRKVTLIFLLLFMIVKRSIHAIPKPCNVLCAMLFKWMLILEKNSMGFEQGSYELQQRM
jgi:hypothetical protein